MEAVNAKRKENQGRYGRYSVSTSLNKAGPAIRSCLEVPAMLLLMFSFCFVQSIANTSLHEVSRG